MMSDSDYELCCCVGGELKSMNRMHNPGMPTVSGHRCCSDRCGALVLGTPIRIVMSIQRSGSFVNRQLDLTSRSQFAMVGGIAWRGRRSK